MTRILIAGVSTRGFAESAARAGYDVVAVDGFGDLDLRAQCREVVVARTANEEGRFSCKLASRRARPLACDAVAYVASFENHPHALRALTRGRVLWGNGPGVVTRARDPLRALQQLNPRTLPRTLSAPPPGEQQRSVRWLVKPRASGGGTGIRVYQPGAPVPQGSYVQEQLAGVAGSVVFAAAAGRGRAVPLGISRMLVGDPAFGAGGFRYSGSILATEGDWREARRLANAAAAAFDLAGVGGVDFISVPGRGWCPIEVNPRYTASMELVERAYGISIFETHAQACAGDLPGFDVATAGPRGAGALGKAIVYARGDVQVGDTAAWLEDGDIRDVPSPGQRIARGQPVCTVFARGRDQQACYAGLVKRAEWIYHALEAAAVATP